MQENIENRKPDIRHLEDMKNLLYDEKWAKTAPNLELYYMYRMIEEKNGLRYDITVIPPQMLGKEFTKTKGHYHIGDCGEIYMVLEGEGMYLMQKGNENNIEDVFAVKATKGDVIVIPKGYGHVTINPSKKEELKMANWVRKEEKGNYSVFEKMHGACYFYTEEGWVKNENYKNVPSLRFEDLSFLN